MNAHFRTSVASAVPEPCVPLFSFDAMHHILPVHHPLLSFHPTLSLHGASNASMHPCMHHWTVLCLSMHGWWLVFRVPLTCPSFIHVSNTSKRIPARRAKRHCSEPSTRATMRATYRCTTARRKSSTNTRRWKAVRCDGDGGDADSWAQAQAPRRRILSGAFVASAVALGGNLGGCTSWTLDQLPASWTDAAKLDRVYPVRGKKRCYDAARGYEFLYPMDWLADRTLYVMAADRVPKLDPGPLDAAARKSKTQREPVAGFGPPGTNGEVNVSVVAAPVPPGFQWNAMGAPEQAARALLEKSIAPPGSQKRATLLDAQERTDRTGQLYYTMEYVVETPRWKRHNNAVYAIRKDMLYTLNVVAPEAQWEKQENELRPIVESFHLIPMQTQTW